VGEDKKPETRSAHVEVDEPQQLKHARIINFNASDTHTKAGAPVRLCYAIADAEHVTSIEKMSRSKMTALMSPRESQLITN